MFTNANHWCTFGSQTFAASLNIMALAKEEPFPKEPQDEQHWSIRKVNSQQFGFDMILAPRQRERTPNG